MKRAAGRVGLVLALLAAGRASAHAGGLSGTITDQDSGAPVEGATVAVSTPAGVPLTTVTTDASGRYALEVRAGGALVVRASARGYQPRFFQGDRFRGAPITVSRSGELANANVALPRAAEISGRVSRRDGTPLFPGYVVLNPVGEYRYNYNLPTGEDGSYRFDDLPAGDYYLNAMAYDAVARQLVGPGWYWPGTEDMNAREAMTLTLGVPAQIDLHMLGEAREPSWIGQVTDTQGRPLAGVQLMILKVVERDGRPDTNHVSVRRTDARGHAQLPELLPGRYRVSTTDVPPPWAPWRDPDPAARGAAVYARHFELPSGGKEATSEFRLRRGRTAHFRMVGESGQALPKGASPSLVLWHAGDQPFGGDGFFARSRPAATAGELEVPGLLSAATYEVRVEGADGRGRWCAATPAVKATLSVPAEENPPTLEVRVRRCP